MGRGCGLETSRAEITPAAVTWAETAAAHGAGIPGPLRQLGGEPATEKAAGPFARSCGPYFSGKIECLFNGHCQPRLPTRIPVSREEVDSTNYVP